MLALGDKATAARYAKRMQTLLIWVSRLALLTVLFVAGEGAIDPHHDASARALPPDVVEHMIFGYLLTILTILSAPRISPWLVGAVFLAAGTGFEMAQILGLVSGTFQWKDLGANLAGVSAALIPLAIARLRR